MKITVESADPIREAFETCAKIAEQRACREQTSRGNIGQILAATQDEEARQIAAAIRAAALSLSSDRGEAADASRHQR